MWYWSYVFAKKTQKLSPCVEVKPLVVVAKTVVICLTFFPGHVLSFISTLRIPEKKLVYKKLLKNTRDAVLLNKPLVTVSFDCFSCFVFIEILTSFYLLPS